MWVLKCASPDECRKIWRILLPPRSEGQAPCLRQGQLGEGRRLRAPPALATLAPQHPFPAELAMPRCESGELGAARPFPRRVPGGEPALQPAGTAAAALQAALQRDPTVTPLPASPPPRGSLSLLHRKASAFPFPKSRRPRLARP